MNAAEAETILRRAGADDDAAIDIARTALAFAAVSRAGARDPNYEAHLHDLTADVAAAAPGSEAPLSARLDALRAILIGKHGYRGDRETYDDLRNADLAHVIDRRRGLPVALSILWLHAARAQGWRMVGLNFPSHFLLRLENGAERAIVDPFNDGRMLGTDELRALLKSFAGPDAELTSAYHAAVSNRAILLRLQNNIKLRLLKQGAVADALPVIERMLLVAPGDFTLWYEAGATQAALENLRAAMTCLERAAALADSPATRQRIGAEIAALRGKLN